MSISRTDGEHVSRRYRDEDDNSIPPPTTRRDAPIARARELAEHRPTATEYLHFLANVRSAATANVAGVAGGSRDAEVQAKLNAVRDAFSGPYVVAGESVSARPMFRMTSHDVPQKTALVVDTLGARAGVRSPFAARMGQPTPHDLVKLTQALIDAGHLPAAPGDVATRIRRMQWDYGIGVDCAGYAKQALAASAARTPKMYAPGMEDFRDVDKGRDGTFTTVGSIVNARPGDLITLDPARGQRWGHNVVVYSHVTVDASKRASLCASAPAVRDFFASAGPHHVLEVDSSWGAGNDGAEEGGYRRDTWLYDAATRRWGSFEPGIVPPCFVISDEGPSHDVFHGTYRPRG